jgi:hypothetical protein
VLTYIRSHTEFSSENSQELNRIASLATGFRNKKGGNLLLLPRTNSLDSTIEVELKTRVHDAAVLIGTPIGTAASASIQEASNVSVQETTNNTLSLDSTIEGELKTRVHDAAVLIGTPIGTEASDVSVQETTNNTLSLDSTIEVELKTRVHDAAVLIGTPIGTPIRTAASAFLQEASNVSIQETTNNTFRKNVSKTKRRRLEQRRKQNQTTLQRPANRSEGYKCECRRPLGHTGLCPFNSTLEARWEVLEGVVVQPMPLVPDVQRLIELHAAGNAPRQEQDKGCGIYKCGNCGPVPRPHTCPFDPCPVCEGRRRNHNDNTFCPNRPKKSK